MALLNDIGQRVCAGAQPRPGTGTHRVFLTVTALDVTVLELPEGASTALLHTVMVPHTLGAPSSSGPPVEPRMAAQVTRDPARLVRGQ